MLFQEKEVYVRVFSGVSLDFNGLVRLYWLGFFRWGEQLELVDINFRSNLAFPAENFILDKTHHLLQMIDFVLLRSNDFYERLGIAGQFIQFQTPLK